MFEVYMLLLLSSFHKFFLQFAIKHQADITSVPKENLSLNVFRL